MAETQRMSRPMYRKRIFTVPSFHRTVQELCAQVPNMKSALQAKWMDQAFAERIMVAVTQVNGCRYCNYGHVQAALAAGVSPEEIEAIRRADLSLAPEGELTVLLYAQHSAETDSKIDPQADAALLHTYGESLAKDIRTIIRFITFANLAGTTIDAVFSRLAGRPAPGSTLGGEMRILAEMLLILPLKLAHRWMTT
jgi:AhpD family alkylhydroperoxidase